MQFLGLTLPTITENLALDEALLLQAESAGGEVLRVWEWPRYAVILGSGSKLAEDVNETACRADDVPILRRSSGGGTVLLGPGCLLYSLVLSYESSLALREIASSYAFILGRLTDALADVLPGVERAGTSDLAAIGRKFSGNSQQRKRSHLLHHGTLLYDFNIACINRYLNMPVKQPDYRAKRTHEGFLMNLPADTTGLTERLRDSWRTDTDLRNWPRDLTRQLAVDKYGKVEWTRRPEQPFFPHRHGAFFCHPVFSVNTSALGGSILTKAPPRSEPFSAASQPSAKKEPAVKTLRLPLLLHAVVGLTFGIASTSAQVPGPKAFLLHVTKGQLPSDIGSDGKTKPELVMEKALGGKAMKVAFAPGDSFRAVPARTRTGSPMPAFASTLSFPAPPRSIWR